MLQVKISELKNSLSACLRKVKSGESILVLDGNTPVARLVPVESILILSARCLKNATRTMQRAIDELLGYLRVVGIAFGGAPCRRGVRLTCAIGNHPHNCQNRRSRRIPNSLASLLSIRKR